MNHSVVIPPTLSLVALLCCPTISLASVPATGTFQATQACQAYQSMKHKTNPDHTLLTIGQQYAITEANTPRGTTWYRVTIDQATPAQRWVYFQCGHTQQLALTATHTVHHSTPSATQCTTAGKADGYVFAVSWQPAFCETHSQKPECQVTDPQAFQANNFTLHGLWPNQTACGTHYGFCGQYKKALNAFCDYPAIKMKAETRNKLEKVMPSAAYHSCLQRHEWYKHGTCQTTRTADGYFELAMRLLNEFNQSGPAAFMQSHLGKTVTTDAFFTAFDHAFFPNAHRRLQLTCKHHKLTDIYIALPAVLSDDASLKSLIKQAPEHFANGCGTDFEVDPIGQ